MCGKETYFPRLCALVLLWIVGNCVICVGGARIRKSYYSITDGTFSAFGSNHYGQCSTPSLPEGCRRDRFHRVTVFGSCVDVLPVLLSMAQLRGGRISTVRVQTLWTLEQGHGVAPPRTHTTPPAPPPRTHSTFRFLHPPIAP